MTQLWNIFIGNGHEDFIVVPIFLLGMLRGAFVTEDPAYVEMVLDTLYHQLETAENKPPYDNDRLQRQQPDRRTLAMRQRHYGPHRNAHPSVRDHGLRGRTGSVREYSGQVLHELLQFYCAREMWDDMERVYEKLVKRFKYSKADARIFKTVFSHRFKDLKQPTEYVDKRPYASVVARWATLYYDHIQELSKKRPEGEVTLPPSMVLSKYSFSRNAVATAVNMTPPYHACKHLFHHMRLLMSSEHWDPTQLSTSHEQQRLHKEICFFFKRGLIAVSLICRRMSNLNKSQVSNSRVHLVRNALWNVQVVLLRITSDVGMMFMRDHKLWGIRQMMNFMDMCVKWDVLIHPRLTSAFLFAITNFSKEVGFALAQPNRDAARRLAETQYKPTKAHTVEDVFEMIDASDSFVEDTFQTVDRIVWGIMETHDPDSVKTHNLAYITGVTTEQKQFWARTLKLPMKSIRIRCIQHFCFRKQGEPAYLALRLCMLHCNSLFSQQNVEMTLAVMHHDVRDRVFTNPRESDSVDDRKRLIRDFRNRVRDIQAQVRAQKGVSRQRWMVEYKAPGRFMQFCPL
jgi:hypothetical protein